MPGELATGTSVDLASARVTSWSASSRGGQARERQLLENLVALIEAEMSRRHVEGVEVKESGMQYAITQNKWGEKGLFSIIDDSGALRFRVAGSRTRSICDPRGEELAAVELHAFRRRADILRSGQAVATVHAAGLGVAENYRIAGVGDEFNAAGDFLGHYYTLTAPGGSSVATVTQRRGFRENFDVEIAEGQDPVLLLAIILAIEDLRDSKAAEGG